MLGIKSEEWDYLLIGDGSATSWDRECGWACVQIENATFVRQDYFGGTSRGTNIMGEMLAYVHPLLELVDRSERRMDDQGFSKVHIVTDCDYVRRVGSGDMSPKKHKAIWACFESFRRCGLQITFHWVPRDVLMLNKLSHELANSARKAMKAYPHTEKAAQRVGASTIYELDPS